MQKRLAACCAAAIMLSLIFPLISLAETSVAVSVETPQARDVSRTGQYSAYLSHLEKIPLRAPEDCVVHAVEVKGGESVKAGDVLCTLKENKNAKETYDILAPMDGKVSTLSISKGKELDQDAVMMVITQEDGLAATISVSYEAVKKLSLNQTAALALDGQTYLGTVVQLSRNVDPQSQLYQVDCAFHVEEQDYLSGAAALVSLPLYTVKNALCVPASALTYEGSQAYVFAAQNGVCRKLPVTVTASDGVYAAVTGLDSQVSVITSWSARLSDGQAIVLSQGQ